MYTRTIFIIFCITLAVYFFIRTGNKEGLVGSIKPRCPNLLVQKGSKIYLYNTKLAEVPGVNPIMFDNLEEYTEFIDWQRSQGIRCPVLYLQEVYDAEGNVVCKARPCVSEPQGGLPPTNATLDAKVTAFRDSLNTNDGGSIADIQGESIDTTNRYRNLDRRKLLDAGHDDPPFNRGHYPSYDPSPFYRGIHTPLDQLDVIEESKPVSANAMDPNWGGKQFTQKLVDDGFYKENELYFYDN